MIGNRSDEHSLRNVTGMGSRSHDLRAVLTKRFASGVMVTGVNWCSCAVGLSQERDSAVPLSSNLILLLFCSSSV